LRVDERLVDERPTRLARHNGVGLYRDCANASVLASPRRPRALMRTFDGRRGRGRGASRRHREQAQRRSR
jgi:hypothetical protein